MKKKKNIMSIIKATSDESNQKNEPEKRNNTIMGFSQENANN